MNRPTCPRCHKPGVQARRGANGPYLANVQTYDSGRSYYRSLHTSTQCDEVIAHRQAEVDAAVEREQEGQRLFDQQARGHMLIGRYKAIYGDDALRDNFERLGVRWLGFRESAA